MVKTKLLLIALLFGIVQLGWSQTRTVTGVVTDEAGVPIPGANVIVQGTTRGTTTDFDGNYTIEVSDSETLVFSYLGYRTQTIRVNNQSTISVRLAEEASALDEVVVTGYTAQSTRNITGSVSVVKAEDLEATSPLNVEQALQGQSSGVVVGSEGGPGGAAAVRIRGFGTINGNDPLYIIDGTPTGAGLNDINPNDIASVQILKDASSAAIYGNRAANGVIIITTKSGKRSSKVTFSANAYVGIDFIPNSVFPELASPQQLADALWQGFNNDGVAPSNTQYGNGADPLLPVYLIPQGAQVADESTYSLENNRITRANPAGTNWFDEYFNSAVTQSYNISATGGNENANFFTSMSALSQDGVGLESGFVRYTLRANSNFSMSERFRIGENITLSYSDQIVPPGNDVNNGTIASLYRIHPLIPIRDVGGNFAGSGVGGLGNANNPIAIADRNKDNDNINLRLLGNIYAEFDLIDNLTFKSNLGFDLSAFTQVRFQPPSYEGESENENTLLSETNSLSRTYTWFNTLTYKTIIGEDNKLDVLVGTEYNRQNFRFNRTDRSDFLVYDPALWFFDNASGSFDGVGFGSISSYFSIFGKADLNLKDTYLISATLRRDATSLFTEENRDGIFPSGSIGWRISNESFMQDSNVFTSLLFKVGYGQIGNNASIRTTARSNTIGPNVSNFNYPLSISSSATGYGITGQGNPDITWETTTTLNVGFSSRLFNVINFDFEYFDATTKDMLLEVPLDPTVLGNNNVVPFNLGEMNNKGFDLTLGYGNSNSEGDFQYNIGLNLSAYRNEVIFLNPDNRDNFIDGDQVRDQIPNRTQAGQPLGSFYGKIWEGIGPDGRVIFRTDSEGNEIRDFIGSPHPDFTYGLTFNGTYKSFDFSMLFQGSQGNDIYNFSKFFIDFAKFPGARSIDYVTGNGLPELTQDANTINSEAEPSTYYLEDGSYLRLKNIIVGYSLPDNIVEALGLSELRCYLQGRNLITLTGYTGLDPEVNLRSYSGQGANLTIGLDSGVYPINRSIIFGLNVSF